MLKFSARTDVGLKRRHNEDSLLAAEDFGLFVVADGVGGRKAGEIASALTVNTFQSYASQLKEAVDRCAADPSRDTRNAVLHLLDQATNAASRRVYEAANATGRQGMTTTMVAALVGGGNAYVCHVGDSRAYLLRAGTLRQLTEDHSMINELVRNGAMRPDDPAAAQYKNVITRAVGLYPQVKTDTLFVELVGNDRLVLCTDGLSDMVEPKKLQDLVGTPDLTKGSDLLIQAALDGGGRDNVTVVLIDPEATQEAEAVAARARVMESLFLFEDLPYQARLRVGRIMSELYLTPGQPVMRQGEAGNTMYVVVQGEVGVVVDGKEVAVLGEGEHFGEIALVDNQPRSASVVARGFGMLLAIDRDALREFCMMEPALGNIMLWKLLATLSERLRRANAQLVSRPT
jgi:serine/threonine protein phosphatase PrpC